MSTIHRFIGDWGARPEWDGARSRAYSQGAQGATETWLIGKAEQAENFAMRYYELEPGGHSLKLTYAREQLSVPVADLAFTVTPPAVQVSGPSALRTVMARPPKSRSRLPTPV